MSYTSILDSPVTIRKRTLNHLMTMLLYQ